VKELLKFDVEGSDLLRPDTIVDHAIEIVKVPVGFRHAHFELSGSTFLQQGVQIILDGFES
jgi:hypothetical protein